MHWTTEDTHIDWQALSHLYRIAPLGDKSADWLRTAYANSRYKCFVYDGETIVGAGRALADGVDCSYLCDIVVHPERQGSGIGRQIIERLRDLSAGHRKIILYAATGKEGFYRKLGFRRMRTAMAIFANEANAIESGLVDGD
jgi:ribosomal protein S18 acetylase RimI-like enzyme